jgi:hypothetical protein
LQMRSEGKLSNEVMNRILRELDLEESRLEILVAALPNGDLSIEDHVPRTAESQVPWEAQYGQQGGDPAKLTQALLTIASQEQPPRRFMASASPAQPERTEDQVGWPGAPMPW